jgi:hypothetical protein
MMVWTFGKGLTCWTKNFPEAFFNCDWGCHVHIHSVQEFARKFAQSSLHICSIPQVLKVDSLDWSSSSRDSAAEFPHSDPLDCLIGIHPI